MSDSPTSKPESDFVCGCEESMRSACVGEPFYKEHEGKRYCVLHFPCSEKRNDFEKVFRRKLTNGDFDFGGVWFPDVLSFLEFDFSKTVNFNSATFYKEVDFRSATFGLSAYFKNATFVEIARFGGATFGGYGDFGGTVFKSDANFIAVTFREGATAFFRSSVFSRDADFSRAVFSTSADFSQTDFAAVARFANAAFSASSDFINTTFGLAFFLGTTFREEAVFSGASFKGADFTSAKFAACLFDGITVEKDAVFYSATFDSEAVFTGAHFKTRADFDSSKFGGKAFFGDARFGVKASFQYTAFSREAKFLDAVFEGAASFRFVTFEARANFKSATFGGDTYFTEASFTTDADFDAASFKSHIEFAYAAFGGYLKFSGSEDRPAFNIESHLSLQFARIEKPSRVSFHSVTLRPHWLVYLDTREFDLFDVKCRFFFQNEIEHLKSQNVRSPVVRLTEVFRDLATNCEDNHRYEEASKYRYWAMNSRRRLTSRSFRFWKLDWWYWIASGYGEKIFRAFFVLLVLWLASAVAYTKVGFSAQPADKSDVAVAQKRSDFAPIELPRALTYSLAVMTLQKPEPKPATATAQTVVLLETILGPVQAALLALAMRRKFMR